VAGEQGQHLIHVSRTFVPEGSRLHGLLTTHRGSPVFLLAGKRPPCCFHAAGRRQQQNADAAGTRRTSDGEARLAPPDVGAVTVTAPGVYAAEAALDGPP
jgi:hypothetical protein